METNQETLFSDPQSSRTLGLSSSSQQTLVVPTENPPANLETLGNFLAGVLSQLASLQTTMVQRIEEIESLEERVNKLEAFNKAIKLRLRQKQEDPLG